MSSIGSGTTTSYVYPLLVLVSVKEMEASAIIPSSMISLCVDVKESVTTLALFAYRPEVSRLSDTNEIADIPSAMGAK